MVTLPVSTRHILKVMSVMSHTLNNNIMTLVGVERVVNFR